MACELDATDCINVLLKHGADLKAEDGQLRSPLLVACENAALRAAKLLIDRGAPLTTTNKTETTPLHWMAFHGSKELAEIAILKGADMDAQNGESQTPLMIAITRGQTEVVNLLLDHSASATIVDDERRTALHLVMQYSGGLENCSEAHAMLQRMLIPASASQVNAQDNEKRTALHWACGKNALPCVEALIKAGANVDNTDYVEQTPLHWACSLDAPESAKALLAAGARPDLADRDKRTPLHYAADRASQGCLELLLGVGTVHVDAVDWGGFSALHHAARRGATACVQELLNKGADRHLVANSGQQPADLAVGKETQDLLREPSLKRKRSLSGNSIQVEAELPELVDKFYAALKSGEKEKLQMLCTASAAQLAQPVLVQASKGQISTGKMHICGRCAHSCTFVRAPGTCELHIECSSFLMRLHHILMPHPSQIHASSTSLSAILSERPPSWRARRTCTVFMEVRSTAPAGPLALHKLTYNEDGLVSCFDQFVEGRL